MELIVDSEPQSMVARIVNSYSRANVKVVELGKRSVKHLSIALPVLSSEKAIRYPLSICTELTQISKTSSLLYGDSSLEKAQTSSWVELANSISPGDFIDYLEKKLLTRTYLVSNHITLADIAAYTVVQNTIGGITFQEKDRFPCIMRWASHLMTLPGLRECLTLFEVPFRVNKLMENYENMFKQGKADNAEQPKEKPVEHKKAKNEENKKKTEGTKKDPEESKKKEEEGKKKSEENKKKAEENKKKGEEKKGQQKKKGATKEGEEAKNKGGNEGNKKNQGKKGKQGKPEPTAIEVSVDVSAEGSVEVSVETKEASENPPQ